MENFRIWWLIFAALILITGAIAGRKLKNGNPLGILIDERGRYSMNRFQLVMWNTLILSTFLAIVFSTWQIPDIPTTLVGLLGISIGSGVMSGAIKAGKDQDPTSQVAKDGDTMKSMNGEATHKITQRPMQMLMVEEGPNADQAVDIGKFQNMIFTASLAIVYIAMAWNTGKFPVFDAEALWLLGISHAGYVGGKIPSQKGPAPTGN